MKRAILSVYLLISASVILLGFRLLDEDFLKHLKAKLTEFNGRYPEERVYLQFDKTLYKPGEDIWFKAYLVNGTTLNSSVISTVLYVELVDPRGAVIKKSELYVEEGTANGDFSLDQNVAGGLYTIRAFTRWMQNFSEEVYFTKEVTVQTVITPRLLLKLDFEKKAYGKNDWVTASLKVRNLKDEPLAFAEVKAQLKLDGNQQESKPFQTDIKGEVKVTFQLPVNLNTTDGLLQVLVSQGGVEESISRSVPIVLNKIQLSFFPEGGEVVAGSGGRVAFKALNEFGKGADVDGIIIDERGRTVSTFQSYHLGIGAFHLNAEKGHQYSAKITRPEGVDQVYPLMTVKSDSLALSVQQKTDSTVVASVFSTSASQAFLVAHVHSQVQFADKLQLHEGWNDLTISTRSMPIGIATFTLFNADGNETSERLVFVNRYKTLRIELKTNRKEYLPGEKVEMTLKTTDQFGVPVQANLSVAVVDDQLLTLVEDKQDNMLSWLLLGTELKGKIEEPSFYFKEDEPKAQLALDYLLMVHGWRRFTWKEISASSQALAYMPENERNLNGFVLDPKSKSSQAEVVLMELNNRKRIAKVKADKNGQFLFRNIDASSPMILLTKRPNTIEVNGVRSSVYQHSDRYNYNYGYRERLYDITPVMEIEDQIRVATSVPLPAINQEVDVSMSADVAQLSEVVVTGYGISRESKALGYSTTRIVNELPPALYATQSIEPQLSGRVAGLMITQSGQPGSSSNLQIRGISSLSNQSEPLWVIDGVPVAGSINSNFAVGSQLTPSNIKTISILKAAEGTALFGCSAANGVILVETKTRADYSNFNYIQKKPKYSVLTISPRTFTVSREFYSEPSKGKESRNNFNTTVFWKHSVVTDKNGEAELAFYSNDAVSAFRITAEGMNGTGLIGRNETTYHTLLPFSLDARLPSYLGFEDTLRLPIRITNNTKVKLYGKLSVEIPEQLRSLSSVKQTVELQPGQTITVPMSIVTFGITGSFPIAITLEGNRHKDKVNQVIQVHPVGFPVRMSYSGKSLSKTINIPMNEIEKGSVKGEIVFVTDVLDDLFTSADALLREPHGCFEQVSSSTFPNILALQLLKKTGGSNPELERKALSFIESGYRLLKGYEINSGGFEWFGKPAAHEALTAFGLIEFKEMQKVFPGVDPAMIERTKKWLLSRRHGNGTFNQNLGKYGFSAAPAEVNNAYIVYALSEAELLGIQPEYSHSLREAINTQDMYLCALMASAALNFGKTEDYALLKSMFTKSVAANGLGGLKAKSSITYSYGNSLINEIVALWTLALMKEQNPDYRLITDCVEFIGTKKAFGMYGSTQATYLSLKVIAEYHTMMQRTRTAGDVLVTVNQSKQMTQSFTQDSRENIVFNKFENNLKEGGNTIGIAFAKTTEALPYTLNLAWNTKTPLSNDQCKLKIETRLRQTEVRLNETVRLTIKLSNTSETGVPMSMAVVGIPAGLSLQPWQLKELKENEAFDFYEIIDNKLALYYRELGPAQTKEINLDLKADLPGAFLSAASCAYLYYSNEFKCWTEGSKVRVVQ